jgi:F-type H+-transporting ATPase subunit gamma
MIPAAKLKEQLEFNGDLGSIIDVLKVAASMQLRHFQSKMPTDQAFLEELKKCTTLFDVENAPHPLLSLRPDLPRCIVGITSDEGFLGELNTLIINALLDARKSVEKDEVVILGERGAGYLRDLEVKFTAFDGISDALSQSEIEKLKSHLIKGYLAGRFGEVVIVYPRFISVTTHKIETTRLLPFAFEEDQKKGQISISSQELLIEPSAEEIVGGLAKLWLSSVLADIFWSSKLSEFAARLMHLDTSEQELKKVNQRLKLEYFRYMHVISDRTIREVSASRFVRK